MLPASHGGYVTVQAVNERNWAGNYRYRATALHRPTTLDQVRELVARPPVRVPPPTPPRRRRPGVAAALGDSIRPVLQVSELRTVAADRLWMSPQYGQDTMAVRFTWLPELAAVESVLVEVEAALAPSEPGPTGASCS